MSQSAASALEFSLPQTAPAAAQWVLKLLSRLKHGCLEIVTPEGECLRFGEANAHPARMVLTNWGVCSRALKSGDIGFAESYIAGEWSTPDLFSLLSVFLLNRNEVEAVIYGSFWGSLAYRIKHWFNRNTKAQAKKNIHAHYDLGNPFYQLWLDPSMTYSSALFNGDTSQSLEQAQHAKYQAMVDWIGAVPGTSILEIGCGWGGFAERAARAGARVTGLTLSTEQLAYAQARLDQQGLGGLSEFRLQDYRDCQGQFDGIASIEMFEAVGEEYWPSYFECVAGNLKPGGRAAVQTIVIADKLFDRYRKSTDFIQQYIFPGGMLPSISVFTQQAERVGLRVHSMKAFGLDYARTLRLWRDRFMHQLDAVKGQGFDEPFIKTWEFYLAYCEAGFAHHNTDVVQFYLEKP